MSAFLVAFFPARMYRDSQRWAERRAVDVTTVVASAVAPALDFGQPEKAQEILEGLDTSSDAVYAGVRNADGSMFAAWNGNQVPDENDPGGTEPVTRPGDKVLDVVSPVVTKGGTRGLLIVGFSLDGLERERAETHSMVLMVSLILFAIGLVASFVIGTLIVRPIVRLTRITEKIVGEGQLTDLTQAIDVDTHDEIGVLAGAFGALQGKLRSIALSLQESASLLTNSVDNLNGSTEQQSQTVTRQASALQETQITAQQMRQTSLLAAQKAQEVLSLAERAEQISRSGEAAVQQSVGGLSDIRSQVEEIAQKIGELSERTQQIGGITQTVKDLADQSNMLALNAAIEAVRSGEHGKGFGVVAREIRSLADQSIQATERVREILGDISRAIDGAVKITDKGAQRIETGLVQVRASGENLGELATIVRDNSGAARQIAAAVSQQNAGIGQIFEAVTELTKMMDDTVRRLESTSNAAQVLNGVADRIAEAVKDFRV
jgi:methyl-accepting chemotaxis protein